MECLDRLSAQIGKENMYLTMSGRSYDMHGAFPASVKVAGEEILAAPIELKAQFNGETQPWDAPHILPLSENAEEIVYTVQQAAGNAAGSVSGDGIDEEMIVMCGLTKEQFNALLDGLRDMSLRVALKAVETPTNQSWSGRKLQAELKKERSAMEEMRRKKT